MTVEQGRHEVAAPAEARSLRTPAHEEARVFHTLDLLRGFAAISVVIFHISGAFTPIAAPGGYLAVDLFFMMSGVVLSHAYESRFRAGMGTVEFMRARLVRLYPLYFLGTILGILVTLASVMGRNIQGWDAVSLLQVAVLALLFLPNLSTRPVDQLFPLNIPCWSLFLEILVNLLFVMTWPWLTSRRLIGVCVISGGAVVLAALNTGHLDLGSSAASFWVGFARTIFGFCMGVLIARGIQRRRRSESDFQVLLITALVGVAVFGWPGSAMRPVWDALCVLLVFPVMVYFATLVDPSHRLRGVATFLGVTSYAIYVLHSPIASVLNSAGRHFTEMKGAELPTPYLGIAVLILLLAGCWLVDKLFDMPVRRLLNRAIPKVRRLPPQ